MYFFSFCHDITCFSDTRWSRRTFVRMDKMRVYCENESTAALWSTIMSISHFLLPACQSNIKNCKKLNFLFSIHFTSKSPGQLHIFWHDGYSLCMNRSKVGVLKETHGESFCRFLWWMRTRRNTLTTEQLLFLLQIWALPIWQPFYFRTGSEDVKYHADNTGTCIVHCLHTWRQLTAFFSKCSTVLRRWFKISLHKRWNGSFRMRRSVVFWYFLISLKATVPGR